MGQIDNPEKNIVEKLELNKKYNLSMYVQVIKKVDQIIVCNTGNGKWFKMPLSCWEDIENYINDYSPQDIINAAYEEDKEYFKAIFEKLIEREILVIEDKLLTSVEIALTNRCNLQCAHCAVSAEKLTGVDKYSTEEWYSIIDKILATNVKCITISGGEPMIRNDFLDIVNYIRNKFNGSLTLMTNGLLISKDNVDFIIKSFNSISMSLDGYDEETCALIRGKGVFSKVIAAIDLLKQHGFDMDYFTLSLTETAITQGRTYKFFELCERIGVKGIIRKFSPIGRGLDNKEMLSLKDYDKFSKEKEYLETESVNDEYLNENDDLGLRCMSCNAGRESIFINSEGDVFPCTNLEDEHYFLGNINEIADIQLLLKNKECNCLKEIRNNKVGAREECIDCNIRPFCQYCLAETSDEAEERYSRCTITKKAVNEMLWGEINV